MPMRTEAQGLESARVGRRGHCWRSTCALYHGQGVLSLPMDPTQLSSVAMCLCASSEALVVIWIHKVVVQRLHAAVLLGAKSTTGVVVGALTTPLSMPLSHQWFVFFVFPSLLNCGTC